MVASNAKLWFIIGCCLIAPVAMEGFPGSSQITLAETHAKPQDVVVRGKVIPLSDALKAVAPELKVDPEPITKEVVLLCDDKTVIPLVPDEASKALFIDPRLHNRPLEIRGRRYAGLPHLQVVTLKVEQDGRFQTPEYFCHVCTISLRYPQTCPCCQGPMEFRMKSDRP